MQLVSIPAIFLAAAAFGQASAEQAFPSHRVVGNVYYVGSKELASYLIVTPEGHMLINSGYEETVPLIRASVESLGYKMRDIKILLSSHAHSDHVAGHALLQELTGAKVYVMRGDDEVISSGGKGQYQYTNSRWKPCAVDRVLKDGDEVTLGGTTLVARRTPGHTRGCTTWTWQVTDGDKKYNVVVIGSPNVNPGYRLVKNESYPEIAEDFAKTFELLKSFPCDVFLGAHGNYYGMLAKHERLQKAPQENPFIDPSGYRAYVDQKEQAYRKTLADQSATTNEQVTLKQNDRIIFFGDSLTALAGKEEPKVHVTKGYVRIVQDTLTANHPDKNIQVDWVATGGHTVPDLLKRVDQDVIAKQPTIVVIQIGCNDARRISKELFQSSLEELIDRLQKAKIQVIQCTLTSVGEKHDGTNKDDPNLDAFAAVERQIAKAKQVPINDLRQAFVAHWKKNNPDNKPSGILTYDGNHFNDAGHKFVAEQMLSKFK